MNDKVIPSVSASRPKVHRLPVSNRRLKTKRFIALATRPVMTVGSIAIAIVFSLLILNGFIPDLRHSNKDLSGNDSSEISMASLAPAVQAATLSGRDSKPIRLAGDSEMIVGQMVKLPPTNDQVTEIKAISEVDNKVGRDLLSILNKY